jgi:hypothetical protein
MLNRLESPEKRTVLLWGCALVFVYVLLRAMLLSFTRDESYTYLEFVKPGHFFTQVYNDMSANNHLLNTWLMIGSDRLLGTSEFSLRLPNVGACILFLYFSFRFAMLAGHQWMSWCAFALLALNPYMLDFFSVARGYGLSLAMTMGSLWNFYTWLSRGYRVRDLLWSFAFAALAVLSNFTLLNYFAFLGIYAFFFILRMKDVPAAQKARWLAGPTLIALTLALIISPVLIRLRNGGSFNLQNFGPPEGLWGDTFRTLFLKLFYEHVRYSWAPGLTMILVLLMVTVAILHISLSPKQNDAQVRFLRFILSALAFFAFFIYFLFFTAGAQFPRDRTGLFFVPFLALVPLLLFCTSRAIDRLKLVFAIPVLGLILLLFTRSANLSYALEYKADANIKEAAMLVREDAAADRKDSVSVGVHYAFFGPFNFYRSLWKLDNWKPAGHDDLYARSHDYYFVMNEDLAEMRSGNLRIMKEYISTRTLLLKNMHPGKDLGVLFSEKNDPETCGDPGHLSDKHVLSGKHSIRLDSAWAYCGLSSFLTDSILARKQVLYRFGAMIYTEDRAAGAHLVISVLRHDSTICWKSTDLYYIIPPGKWEHFTFSAPLPPGVQPGDEVRAYVWNNRAIDIYVDGLELEALDLSF